MHNIIFISKTNIQFHMYDIYKYNISRHLFMLFELFWIFIFKNYTLCFFLDIDYVVFYSIYSESNSIEELFFNLFNLDWYNIYTK